MYNILQETGKERSIYALCEIIEIHKKVANILREV